MSSQFFSFSSQLCLHEFFSVIKMFVHQLFSIAKLVHQKNLVYIFFLIKIVVITKKFVHKLFSSFFLRTFFVHHKFLIYHFLISYFCHHCHFCHYCHYCHYRHYSHFYYCKVSNVTLVSSKGNFFTKSTDQQKDRPTDN